MQNWFNKLNLTYTLIICSILAIVGIALIFLRINNDTPYGLGMGALLVIESIILLYKKYFSGKSFHIWGGFFGKKKYYFIKKGLFSSDFIQSFTHIGRLAFGILKLKILEASSDLINLPFLTTPVLTNKVEVIRFLTMNLCK